MRKDGLNGSHLGGFQVPKADPGPAFHQPSPDEPDGDIQTEGGDEQPQVKADDTVGGTRHGSVSSSEFAEDQSQDLAYEGGRSHKAL